MRLMSFRMTVLPFYRRLKTETRRMDAWHGLKAGELLCGVVKGQGLKLGEEVQRLHVIRIEDVYSDYLDEITPEEVAAEGFPGLPPKDFVDMFLDGHKPPADWDEQVTIISFSYVPGGRFAVPGICRRCGCTAQEGCLHEEFGNCWWVNDAGRESRIATSLCSHCFHGWGTQAPTWRELHEMAMA